MSPFSAQYLSPMTHSIKLVQSPCPCNLELWNSAPTEPPLSLSRAAGPAHGTVLAPGSMRAQGTPSWPSQSVPWDCREDEIPTHVHVLGDEHRHCKDDLPSVNDRRGSTVCRAPTRPRLIFS